MVFLATMTLSLVTFQEVTPNAVEDWIRKLGSPKFLEREEAKKWLLAHPDQAAPALRAALQATDLETAKRAASMLKEIDSRPLRAIQKAIEEKAVQRALNLLTKYPQRKDDASAWYECCNLARLLLQLHEQKGGRSIPIRFLAPKSPFPELLTGPDATIPEQKPSPPAYFIHSNRVLVDKHSFPAKLLILSAGPVHIPGPFLNESIVFGSGKVKVDGLVGTAVIVSNGDVTLAGLTDALVIAKGKVTCNGNMWKCRIISGKTVTYRSAESCIITENESAPLGLKQFFEKTVPPSDNKQKSTTSGK